MQTSDGRPIPTRRYTFKTVLCIRKVVRTLSRSLSLCLFSLQLRRHSPSLIVRDTFRDNTAPTRAGIRHWCYGFYCFTVVQWPGRPERLQFPASPPDARRSRLAPSPSTFPHPDGATTGRGIVAAKGCWGYPGGRGKNLLWERVGGLYLTPLLR